MAKGGSRLPLGFRCSFSLSCSETFAFQEADHPALAVNHGSQVDIGGLNGISICDPRGARVAGPLASVRLMSITNVSSSKDRFMVEHLAPAIATYSHRRKGVSSP